MTTEPVAAVMTLGQCWALSERWYEGRLDLDDQRPAAAHYQALLSGAGLTGEAWSLTPPPAG